MTSSSASPREAATRRLTSGSPWDTNPILSPSAKYVVFMRAPSKGARSDRDRAGLPDRLRRDDARSPAHEHRYALDGLLRHTDVRAESHRYRPGSDWLVTPQYLTEDPSSFGGVGGRLLVTNVPIDSTWVSWNVGFRPTGALTLSRSSKAGCVKVTRSPARRTAELQRLHRDVLALVARRRRPLRQRSTRSA